jgi:DNA-binding MarR family transcriptional regulator
MWKMFDELPGLKMHKAVFGIAKRVEKELQAALGLSLPQFMLLMSIKYGEKCSQAQIAKARGLTEAAVSRMMDTVLEKKLATRVENPNNRRERILELTDEGKITAGKSMKIAENVVEEIFFGLSSDERKTLDIILDKILQSIYSEKRNYA